MITTATYIIKAVINSETYMFMYEHCYDVWEALKRFWHEDYPKVLIDKGCLFPLDIMSMLESRVMYTYSVTFNTAVFHAFFDNGFKHDGHYTLDQFAKDIQFEDI